MVRCEYVLVAVLKVKMLRWQASYHLIRCQIQIPAYDVSCHFGRMGKTILTTKWTVSCKWCLIREILLCGSVTVGREKNLHNFHELVINYSQRLRWCYVLVDPSVSKIVFFLPQRQTGRHNKYWHKRKRKIMIFSWSFHRDYVKVHWNALNAQRSELILFELSNVPRHDAPPLRNSKENYKWIFNEKNTACHHHPVIDECDIRTPLRQAKKSISILLSQIRK